MNFTVDVDEGRSIRGWIVLDNPAATPKLTLIIPNRPEISIEANIYRADIQEIGHHLTGHVGFDVNDSLVADLAELEDVALVESESRLMIFRRSRPQHVGRKLIIFDASVMPQAKIMRQLAACFTHYHFHCERFSFETMFVIIHSYKPSTLLYGRSSFNRYTADLNNAGFLRAALLQEPYMELAERLLTLKLVANRRFSNIESITGLDRCLSFAQDLKLNDEKAMMQAFRRLDGDARDLLANPMTRMLACDLDASAQRRHVSVALENLATMDVVGVRAEFDLFRRMLAATVGADVVGDEPPVALDMVAELAQKLARIAVVEDMLDCDRQLYEFVRGAMAVAAENSDVGA
jgi:hypothetical protein